MTQPHPPAPLRLLHEGPVVRLLIDRGAKHNAMTRAMWQSIPGLVVAAQVDPAARILVVQSATPGLFCAGADIAEMRERGMEEGFHAENQAEIGRARQAIAGARLPTLAFVDGDCVGGGCVLALACDIRVASERARFGVPPARLGIAYPLPDTRRLVELIGPGQASRLLFSARLIDAAEALRIGLVEEIAPDPEQLVAEIAGNSAWSIAALKGFVRRVLDGQREDDAATLATFAAGFAGEDFHARTAAFLARKG